MPAKDSSTLNRRELMRGFAYAFGGAALLPTQPVALGASRPAAAGAALQGGFPPPRFLQSNGIRMAVYELGDGFPVVFSHGFPELAYSWRHQLRALAEAGFRAIAPDQRGYGNTERPEAVEAYDIHHLCGDLVGLLDALELERAVFCGHDWGGLVVWSMPLLHPDRVAGVIGVNTPFLPRSPVPPIEMLRNLRGENNYIVSFQEPGVADRALARDVRKTFTALLRTGGLWDAESFAKLPADAPERNFDLLSALEGDEFPGRLVVSEEELDFYVKTFERTGFTGGINWYRNIDRNWESMADAASRVEVPSLYVGAEDDVVLPPAMARVMETWVPDLEKHVIPECGHWTQQEKPEELNKILIDWLRRRFGKASA